QTPRPPQRPRRRRGRHRRAGDRTHRRRRTGACEGVNLLGPELVEFLRRVRFVGLAASAPFGHGERRSLATGAGVEFAELRPYEPGDDLRRVDYSAFLRHGRLYTKLFHADGPGSIALFIDSSASMTCGEPPKFRFALVLAAA